MGNRAYLLVFMLVLILLTTLTGCTFVLTTPAAPQPTEQIITQKPTNTTFLESPETLTPKPSLTPPSILTPIEAPNLQPEIDEVPEQLLEDIIAALVQRTGTAREDIQVIKAEAVVWSDASLGCPKKGEVYIQILIKGYWVILEVEGVEYDYRVSGTGHFTLCEGSEKLPPILPSSAPSN
jgi:hypothetical protein